jgi:LETM1 and EF-hand domain-containing protein 1
MSPEQERDV